MNRSAIVFAVALPGALLACWANVLAAAFAGDASPTPGGQRAWFIWAVVGGVCLGSLPAALLGLAWRKWWVLPLIGGAVGAVPGVLDGFGVHVFRSFADGRFINVAGYGSAACTLLGLAVGLVAWQVVEARQRADRSPVP